jgi:hypothetical protein
MNAAKFPTVVCPSEEVITLGGNPPPASSHPPRPSPPHVTAGSLKEVFGQVGQPPDVLHHFSDPLVSPIPGGAKIDVEVSNEEGGMSFWTLVEGLFDLW